jgi:hypothetical protein
MITGFQFKAALITSKDTAQNIAHKISVTQKNNAKNIN